MKALPFADPGMDYDIDAIRLGLLTYIGMVKDSGGRRKQVLFTCDCGRVVLVPFSYVKGGLSEEGKLPDLPWSCGECELGDITDMKKPWKRLKTLGPHRAKSNKRAVKHRAKSAKRFLGKKDHVKEWYAWQQARRQANGVVKRWMEFENFYNDMGDKPDDSALAKKDQKLRHGPDNSYWRPLTAFHWCGQRVTPKWIMKEFNIPKPFVWACQKAGIVDVQKIIAMHQSGQRPPRPPDKFFG